MKISLHRLFISRLPVSFNMPLNGKTSYHPHFVVAFYLNCLPEEWRLRIPRSTRHDWLHRDQCQLFGFEWSAQNRQLLTTLQQVAASRRLIQVNRALLRVIALRRFMTAHAARIRDNVFCINDVVLNTIEKLKPVLGLSLVLKGIGWSYSAYIRLRNRIGCQLSVLPLCRHKHPGQLLQSEVQVIKSYCSDGRFLHWPLASVFHQIIRDKAAAFSIHTFYKYISLLNIRRSCVTSRRKHHTTGIRAERTFQILHADTTLFRTADQQKHYIHLVQDNYSRAILGWKVSSECLAKNVFEVLSAVIDQHLVPAGVENCTLLTDDGSENAGEVKLLVKGSINPSITHLIAQRDVQFSNSMIEAANKHLKYRFLYHHHIADYKALVAFIIAAIKDFNNRPHHVLNGLTPAEVLEGHRFDRDAIRRQIAAAKATRIIENKKTRCCHSRF